MQACPASSPEALIVLYRYFVGQFTRGGPHTEHNTPRPYRAAVQIDISHGRSQSCTKLAKGLWAGVIIGCNQEHAWNSPTVSIHPSIHASTHMIWFGFFQGTPSG